IIKLLSLARRLSSGSYKFFVIIGAEQSPHFGRITDTDLYHPALAVRIFVHALWRTVNVLVYFKHLAAERHKKVAYCFYSFHCSENSFTCNGFAYCVYINIYDIAQLALRKISDANGCFVTIYPDPLMVFGILQVCGEVHS